ncbi:hypothetical protein QNI19_03595 [Cytophagaceae bacterium DM2B3-1]|uniref:Uncharacterized protein n=1 Tax=Xanthocytophaga flava TaxID=3048013 RepID=A0AAE3U716_9BACT|nr:hypothetical protein [Xanthocytophaga flavus]MDJ1473101.1 hypothetical protein [Xanthocytophaga flavus]MDJ1482444.1 hypothetical protein [Xanthocytophaga flavus]MDJ1492002.1 hypothetical protein [Xanthocytophaga flavus]
MAKLKNIIKQLSPEDYDAIYNQLMTSNAEKSAYLLKFMREKQLSDSKIMEQLDVNTNAYYTLRSRLNQKIEEYLLQQMESPRTDLLKKVANITEILFTKKRAIAVATLKKLEKELLDYDLSNELTIIYKSLKKLHINSPDFYNYSQSYNRHVAYMLAIDKAEDLLSEYFKKYGNYTLSGTETEKLELTYLNKEMENVCKLYQSHRLYVYQNCMSIFHRLFVENTENLDDDQEPIEDVLNNVEKIFQQYNLDTVYYHLKLVFEFLKLEYYTHYKVYKKAEKYFDEVNDAASTLLTNYSLYTYPAQFLFTKVQRHIRLDTEQTMYEENEGLFQDYEADAYDLPKYTGYVVYRAVCCYYSKKYDEAARWVNNLLNEMSLKKYPIAHLEVKLLLALQYCLLNDYELFSQLLNSIQRQIRIMGKDECEHMLIFTKIMKTSLYDSKNGKAAKIRGLIDKLQKINVKGFTVITLIKMDESFVARLSS